MGISISILGLDRLGASIGLALGREDGHFSRRGYDPQPEKIRKAKEIKAIDQPFGNLNDCVQQAQVILLALPGKGLRQVLEEITAHLADTTLILDIASVKAATFQWLQSMKPGLSYIALGLNTQPTQWNPSSVAPGEPNPFLFQDLPHAIACPPGTSSKALDLASSFVKSLGGQPFFCDLAELEGWEATTKHLPLLLSSVLMHSAAGLPGWRDAGKLAGADFANATGILVGMDQPLPSGKALTLAASHLLPRLDSALDSLQILREAIQNGEADKVEQLLQSASLARETWLKDKVSGEDPQIRMPERDEFWKRQAGFLAGRKKPEGG